MSKLLFKTVVFFVVIFLTSVPAYAAPGGIIDGFHTTQVCHDSTCTTPTPGILNFRPTGATAVVVDDVTGLSGNVWGNELGWITLNPTGEGVVFADATTGLLTGKAWSQVSGWINFAPTGQSVTIDPNSGEFSGWAWTGGPYGGWIKFDCGDGDTCIKTTWTSSSDDGGGGSSGGGSVPDVCPNLEGYQYRIPTGYTVDEGGNCISFFDACPNLVGAQSTVPPGFVKNSFGACVPNVDYCPNIAGMQTTIPSGYTVSSSGNCIAMTTDVCPSIPGIQSDINQCGGDDQCSNISGIQIPVPQGYESSDGFCFLSALDVCNNIEGNQFFLPENMMLTDIGECVSLTQDLCGNLGGIQQKVPVGFYGDAGNCFFGTPPERTINEGEEVVAFPFIPSVLQIPVDDDFLTTIVKRLDLNASDTFKVDAISAIVSAGVFLFLLFLLIRLLRLFL